MDTLSSLVSQTIHRQIGHRAFVMLGARNIVGGEDFLEFKIGRNPKRVSHIRVTLDRRTDSYTLRFFHVGRAPTYPVTERDLVEGVYWDMLRDVIENHTGLYTSL